MCARVCRQILTSMKVLVGSPIFAKRWLPGLQGLHIIPEVGRPGEGVLSHGVKLDLVTCVLTPSRDLWNSDQKVALQPPVPLAQTPQRQRHRDLERGGETESEVPANSSGPLSTGRIPGKTASSSRSHFPLERPEPRQGSVCIHYSMRSSLRIRN